MIRLVMGGIALVLLLLIYLRVGESPATGFGQYQDPGVRTVGVGASQNRSAPATYQVAHGDILSDGQCHIRVSGPNQPVSVTSSGTYRIETISAASASELAAKVESVRAGASRWAGMPCPNG